MGAGSAWHDRTRVTWWIPLVVVAIVASACGGGDATEPAEVSGTTPADVTETTPAATEDVLSADAGLDDPFLTAVAEADRPSDEALVEFFSRLDSQYTNGDAYMDALTNIGLYDAIALGLDRAGGLAPPAEYAEAFGIWSDNLEVALALAGDLEDALAARDLGAVSRAVTLLRAQSEGALLRISASSPDLCRALAGLGTDHPADERFVRLNCLAPEDLPGGDYGQDANRIAREVAATVFPLIGTAPLGFLDDDELVAFLAEIQPIVEAEFARGRERLAVLTPPAELADDHDAALTYLQDIGDIARRITEAAEAGDQEALLRLFDESARPGRALGAALSEGGTAIFGTLGGAPEPGTSMP